MVPTKFCGCSFSDKLLSKFFLLTSAQSFFLEYVSHLLYLLFKPVCRKGHVGNGVGSHTLFGLQIGHGYYFRVSLTS